MGTPENISNIFSKANNQHPISEKTVQPVNNENTTAVNAAFDIDHIAAPYGNQYSPEIIDTAKQCTDIFMKENPKATKEEVTNCFRGDLLRFSISMRKIFAKENNKPVNISAAQEHISAEIDELAAIPAMNPNSFDSFSFPGQQMPMIPQQPQQFLPIPIPIQPQDQKIILNPLENMIERRVSIPATIPAAEPIIFAPTPRPELVKPEIINPIQQAEPILPVPIDNTEMIQKYPFLESIQNIALSCGHTVKFDMIINPHKPERSTGLIGCVTYDRNGIQVLPKSFTIDTGGAMYDHRVKVFSSLGPGFTQVHDFSTPDGKAVRGILSPVGFGGFCYEMHSAWGVFDNNSYKFDENLFKEIFTGGVAAISKRQLYDDTWKKLNSYLAMISLPTKKIAPDVRKATQAKLVELMNQGLFAQVSVKAPGSRFRFIEPFNNQNDFVISNEDIDKVYLGPLVSTVKVVIKVTPNGTKIQYPDGEEDFVPMEHHH